MKRLLFTVVLPLSIISFALITKWWYALPADAPGTIYYGFPFPFVANGWHTSMSLQIFVAEFVLDFLLYFLICFFMVYCIQNYLLEIKPSKIRTIVLWSLATIIIVGALFIASSPDHLIYLRRTDTMEIKESGIKFLWQQVPQLSNEAR
jgi:hypothetical protein